MTAYAVRIRALAPLLFRDPKPFAADGGESRAHSLDLPPVSTIAGLVRTFVGEQLHWDWADPRSIEASLGIRITGIHVERQTAGHTCLVVPAPATAVVYLDETTDAPAVLRLEPDLAVGGQGHDTPGGLAPLRVTEDVKALSGYRLWRWSDLQAWLSGATPVPALVASTPIDERVHTAIDRTHRAAADGMLFTAQYRGWDDGDNGPHGAFTEWRLAVTFESPELSTDRAIHTFGGERRPVSLQVIDQPTSLEPTTELRAALTSTAKVTLQLATDGLFDLGWRPAWLSDPAGLHPALAGARLVSAAVGKHVTVSGWAYEQGRRGPKATRWAVPAGSTYFLELSQPLSDDAVDALWWTSVCDQDRDRADAYGLAIWGVWNS